MKPDQLDPDHGDPDRVPDAKPSGVRLAAPIALATMLAIRRPRRGVPQVAPRAGDVVIVLMRVAFWWWSIRSFNNRINEAGGPRGQTVVDPSLRVTVMM